MVKTVCVFNCLSKFAQGPLFLTFEQSFMFLQLKKTLHKVIFSKFFKAGSGSAFLKQMDPDPHSKKLLGPDPEESYESYHNFFHIKIF